MNMHLLQKIFLTITMLSILLMGFSCAPTEGQEVASEEWEELFNGENLDGWDFKITGYDLNENYANTFRVEDRLMKVRYDEYEEFTGQFAHIFYEKPFSYYRLKVEYRFVEEQAPNGPAWAFMNNGIMFHSQSASSMEKDQDFPDSIEYQLLGGDGENERSNGNICSPGTHVVIDGELITNHCTSANGPTHHGDQWVTAELVAHGSSKIQHILNNEVVLEYTKPQLDNGQRISGGYIALQGESHPTDIRSVKVLNLEGCMEENDPNYKDYFVKHDSAACQN